MYLITCGTGTTCSVPVTRANTDLTSFTAVVVDGGNVGVASSVAEVYWHGPGLELTQSAPTVPLGDTITLTALTDHDVGPSPFYVQIYDVTAATIVASCGNGTRCVATVGQTTATTHRYRACFTAFSSSFPPSNALQCTADHSVSWTNALPSVLLTASPAPDGSYTVTALTSNDVTPGNSIQIYTLEGGRIASCGSGSICSTSFTPGPSAHTLVGFVSPSSLAPPLSVPSALLANSHVVSVNHCPPPYNCQGAPIAVAPVIGPTGFPPGPARAWALPPRWLWLILH